MADENEQVQPIFWPGPWHFVQATIEADEMWSVNRIPTRIHSGAIVAFMLTDDALHFITQGRAADLGVWNTFEDLHAAVMQSDGGMKEMATANAAEPAAVPIATPAVPPRRRGRPPKTARLQ